MVGWPVWWATTLTSATTRTTASPVVCGVSATIDPEWSG